MAGDRGAGSRQSRTTRPASPPARNGQSSSTGFILCDRSLLPAYANEAAFQILSYSNDGPDPAGWDRAVQAQLRLIFRITEYSDDTPIAPFVSGSRHYICRSFRLDAYGNNGRQPLIAFLLERPSQLHVSLLEASRRFHLSQREAETVLHLTHGLTTKEIARRMHVSPNTVKQFVRLIMTKMNVTTRAGILGKLL